MVEKCDFDRQFSCDSYLLNCSSNFTIAVTLKSYVLGLSNCERIISVFKILSALEYNKVRLPIFDTTYMTKSYKIS